MKRVTRQVPADCTIILTGDTHDGSNLFAREAYQELLAEIHDTTGMYLIHMGDACESRCTDHRYFELATADPDRLTPDFQVDSVVETHRCVSGKILAWLQGNHEWSLHRYGDLSARIARELQAPYGTYTCRLALNDAHGCMMKLFLTHGIGCQLTSNAKDLEQQQANMKATLKRRLQNKSGDCVLMACGDTHKLLVVQPAQRLFLAEDDRGTLKSHYVRPGDGQERWIEPDRRWYVNTGSWLKMYQEGVSGYAERFGFDPIELGYARIEIRDRKIHNVEKVVV